MSWSSVRVTSPGLLPLQAADLRTRLRIDTASEDDALAAFLAAAASDIDGPDGAGVAMMAQTWTRTLDGWAGDLCLPGWPVTGVAEIRYLDRDGDWQVLDHAAAFRLVLSPEPARLVRRPGAPALPALQAGPGTVEVDYTLGRATAADVDQGLVTALALIAGHYFENREATAPGEVREVPLGAQHILARFRRGRVG